MRGGGFCVQLFSRHIKASYPFWMVPETTKNKQETFKITVEL
jgi:hypothetical protein